MYVDIKLNRLPVFCTKKCNFYIDRDISFPTGGPSASVFAPHSVCTLDWNRGVQECIGWQWNVQTLQVLHERHTLSLIYMVHDTSLTL